MNTPAPPSGSPRRVGLRRAARVVGADGALAIVLFLLLASLSWRRWASFEGDLNREWTTPARVAAGERLYRDVSWYYGPLAPLLSAAAMRVAGARVGTAITVDLGVAACAIALLLAASRRFLSLPGRLAVASTAVGVVAFAPDNGALVVPYSSSALLAVLLSWSVLLAAARNRPVAAGVLAAAALLAKVEALPALVAAGALLSGRRSRLFFAASALALSTAGYAAATAGLPLTDLIRYGPLRHVAMPPEFRELYLRISGLHPDLAPRAIRGVAAGALLFGGWLALAGGLLAGKTRRGAAGAALLAGGALLAIPLSEPPLTTLFRAIPTLTAGALVLSLLRLGKTDAAGPSQPALVAAASAVGLSFAWRTALWSVPSLPYAPLAAFSCLPSIAWLASEFSPTGVARRRGGWFVAAPLLLAPLFFLPRLVGFYRSPRTLVVAPRGTWLPPGGEGELFARLVSHLSRTGVSDRSLVVLPEASALNFLMGVRSPLRLEQILPGHLDDGADEDAARCLRDHPPERIVLVSRPTPEYGGATLGIGYGRRLMAEVAAGWREEARYSVPDEGPGRPALREAVVLRRRSDR